MVYFIYYLFIVIEMGLTGFNNSIFVMEKRIYDEKRKKDVQKGYITFNEYILLLFINN